VLNDLIVVAVKVAIGLPNERIRDVFATGTTVSFDSLVRVGVAKDSLVILQPSQFGHDLILCSLNGIALEICLRLLVVILGNGTFLGLGLFCGFGVLLGRYMVGFLGVHGAFFLLDAHVC
jgi:hypothetical protein